MMSGLMEEVARASYGGVRITEVREKYDARQFTKLLQERQLYAPGNGFVYSTRLLNPLPQDFGLRFEAIPATRTTLY